jgi:hypothetical protein
LREPTTEVDVSRLLQITTVEVADDGLHRSRRTHDDFLLAPDETSSAPAQCQAKPAFASSPKKRPPLSLFEVSTPPFSRMKVMGSAVRFPLPSI